MAERRMFAKTIIDSDAFLDMPLSTQALYFHLSMRADDDGFINNFKKIQRMIGASEDDIKVLIMKNFIIPFDSGVVVIKHWRIHNYIQKDRYKPTMYTEEKKQLDLKENKGYTLINKQCIHNVSKLDTQDRLELELELELDKDNIYIVENVNAHDDSSIPYSEIIDHLNNLTGASFKHSTKKTKDLIKARFKEGFTLENFKMVIEKKVIDWKNDDKMKKYLRPETLFGNKFEGYLNEPVKKITTKDLNIDISDF